MQFIKFLLPLSLLLLSGCEKPMPSCDDPRVIDLLKGMIKERVASSTSDYFESAQLSLLKNTDNLDSIKFELPRPTKLDVEIGKTYCSAHLEYDVLSHEKYEAGLEKISNVGDLAAHIDGYGGNLAQKMARAFSDGYNHENHKIQLELSYDAQLMKDGSVIVTYELDNIQSLQAAIISDASSALKKKEIKKPEFSVSDYEIDISKATKEAHQTFKANGSVGMVARMNECYRDLKENSPFSDVVYCLSFDSVCSIIASTLETQNNWPRTPEFLTNTYIERIEKNANKHGISRHGADLIWDRAQMHLNEILSAL